MCGMKIFCLDSNYDQEFKNHGKVMCDIIRYYSPTAVINFKEIPPGCGIAMLTDMLMDIYEKAELGDIMLISWNIPPNAIVEQCILDIAKKCSVIVAAGNQSHSVTKFTPQRLQQHVTVVHAIKKNGELASFTNYGDHTVPMYGTNVTCADGVVRSGTSISAAIYTGIISRNNDPRFFRRVFALMRRKYLQEIS